MLLGNRTSLSMQCKSNSNKYDEARLIINYSFVVVNLIWKGFNDLGVLGRAI